MPVYLKKDSIRLFEASLECLSLAILSLGAPHVKEQRVDGTQYAPSIGLIGASAELALSATYSQASGPKVLLSKEKLYKPAGQILSEFIDLLKSPTPQLAFLTVGVSEPHKHRQSIIDSARTLKLVTTARAGALHAGRGPNRTTCIILANKVCDFLRLLSLSDRIRPYLSIIPTPHDSIVEYSALLTELYDKLSVAKTNIEKASLLTNMYLVLPDIPENKPEWLDALERLSVAPKSSDIMFLIDSLATSAPITFKKTSQGGTPLSVKITPSDPNAIPIAPHYIKSEFVNASDKFHADIANANGRLKDKCLDLPPALFVIELFVSGLEDACVLGDDDMLTAHKAWPFIVASLDRSGTPGPFWFLVRKTSDLSQLMSLLKQAANLGNKRLKKNIKNCLAGIDAIKEKVIVTNKEVYESALNQARHIEANRLKLNSVIERNIAKGKSLPEGIEEQLVAVDYEDESFGGIIAQIVDLEIDTDTKWYWIKSLTEMCDREEDLPGIYKAFKATDRSDFFTVARKVIMALDFLYYGPDIPQ